MEAKIRIDHKAYIKGLEKRFEDFVKLEIEGLATGCPDQYGLSGSQLATLGQFSIGCIHLLSGLAQCKQDMAAND